MGNSDLAYSGKLNEIITYWTASLDNYPGSDDWDKAVIISVFELLRDDKLSYTEAYVELHLLTTYRDEALGDLFTLMRYQTNATTIKTSIVLGGDRRLFIDTVLDTTKESTVLSYKAGLKKGDRVIHAEHFRLPAIFCELPAYLSKIHRRTDDLQELINRVILLTLEINDHARQTRKRRTAAFL
jgi:hypothetical protein